MSLSVQFRSEGTLFNLEYKKNQKQKPNFLKRAKRRVVLIIYFMISSQLSRFMLLLFITVAVHESGTRKAISWSVTVYNIQQNSIQSMQSDFSDRTSVG